MKTIISNHPELEADTANIFEVSRRDVESMNHRELRDLLGEADYFTRKLASLGFRGAKEVSIIVARGSNVNIHTKEALDFLRNRRVLVASQIPKFGSAVKNTKEVNQ